MKINLLKFLNYIVILFSLGTMLFVTSCDKDEDVNPGQENSTGDEENEDEDEGDENNENEEEEGEDDDNNNGSPIGGEVSSASFTVSGSQQGNKTGYASVISSSAVGNNTLTISIHDGVNNEQTYSLQFSQTSSDAVQLPQPGEYTIGTSVEQMYGNVDFMMVYTNVENSKEYGLEASGTIVIEEVTDTHLIGEFSFTAEEISFDEGPTGSISVQDGEFSALIQLD